MTHRWRLPFALVFGLLLIAPGSGLAKVDDVTVDGETISFGADDVIHNLKVVNGGAAYLDGTTVTGSVTVEGEGSYLNMYGVSVDGNAILRDGGFVSMWYTTIEGNLLGDRYYHINFLISEVGGNIQLTDGGDFNAPYGPCTVGNNVHITGCGVVGMNWFAVGGNVQISDCQSPSEFFQTYVVNSTIDGKLHVFGNEIAQGILIDGNTIGGHLIVRDNTPDATIGDNDVGGKVDVD
jgi:hypothetical protein